MDSLGAPARGAATCCPAEELRARVLGAWDSFLSSVGPAPDPVPALVALGDWPEDPFLSRLFAEARGEVTSDSARPLAEPPAPRALRAALERARGVTADALDLLAKPDSAALAAAPVSSVYGPLPLLTQVHAVSYQLALAVLESADAVLLDAACAALLDVVGALAFRRGLRVAAAAHTTDLPGWYFRASREGWTLSCAPARDLPGPEGRASVLLALSAGRASLPTLLARRELRLRRLPQLLPLAPLLDDLPVPIPLPRAVTGLLGRLPF